MEVNGCISEKEQNSGGGEKIPPSLSENISLGNITEGRVAIATPPKPI